MTLGGGSVAVISERVPAVEANKIVGENDISRLVIDFQVPFGIIQLRFESIQSVKLD